MLGLPQEESAVVEWELSVRAFALGSRVSLQLARVEVPRGSVLPFARLDWRQPAALV